MLISKLFLKFRTIYNLLNKEHQEKVNISTDIFEAISRIEIRNSDIFRYVRDWENR